MSQAAFTFRLTFNSRASPFAGANFGSQVAPKVSAGDAYFLAGLKSVWRARLAIVWCRECERVDRIAYARLSLAGQFSSIGSLVLPAK